MKKNYIFLFVFFNLIITHAQVVISQVYGGGGNTGATYQNDFIELFNKGTAPVNIGGWSVQYGAAAGVVGGSLTLANFIPAGTTIQPGKYFLIKAGSGGMVGTVLPTIDYDPTLQMPAQSLLEMSQGSGKVALFDNTVTTFVNVSNPVTSMTSGLKDFVGYGSTANAFEGSGSTGSNLSSILSAQRLFMGCTDNNNNASDFETKLPAPRNSMSPTNVCSTEPSIAVSLPANNAIFNPETTTVNVVLGVANFTLGGANTISYKVNGGSAQSTTSTTLMIPVSINNTYSVVAELLSGGAPLSPAKTTTINFSVANYINVATLKELRDDILVSGINPNRYFNITGNPIVTYSRPVNTGRNQKYIQDATSAIVIDDPGTTPLITTPFAIGDGMSNLKGRLSLNSGLLQFTPITNATVASTGNTIVPESITLASLIANPSSYESELVKITTPITTTATGNWTITTNFTFSDPSMANITFRTLFPEANYIGQPLPSGSITPIVLVGKFNTTTQITSRNLADLDGLLSNDEFSEIDNLSLRPNPIKDGNLYITTPNNSELKVSIVNMLGEEVVKSKIFNNYLDVSSLSSGLYVLKVEENGKTSTRKIVIE